MRCDVLARAYHLIEKYRVEVVTTTPLHIGSGAGEDNEVLLHPVTEAPFMQSSSIAAQRPEENDLLIGKLKGWSMR